MQVIARLVYHSVRQGEWDDGASGSPAERTSWYSEHVHTWAGFQVRVFLIRFFHRNKR
jgi:hypothetical protein